MPIALPLNLLIKFNRITYINKNNSPLIYIKHIIDKGYDDYIAFYIHRSIFPLFNNIKNISYFI